MVLMFYTIIGIQFVFRNAFVLHITSNSRLIQKVSSRDGMTGGMGMCMYSSREGVCGSNAVQFQSYDSARRK